MAVVLCCCYGCVDTLISGLKGLSYIPLPLTYIPITNVIISSLQHKSGTFLTAQTKGYEKQGKVLVELQDLLNSFVKVQKILLAVY